MTRIHKKPGSAAWKKAVQKSASRMARDLLRAPLNKVPALQKKYLENKGGELHRQLIEGGIFESAVARRAARLKKESEEFQLMYGTLQSQDARVKKIMAKKKTDRMTLDELNGLRDAARIVLAITKQALKKSKFVAKNMQKQGEQKVKKVADDLERLEKNHSALIAQIESLIIVKMRQLMPEKWREK